MSPDLHSCSVSLYVTVGEFVKKVQKVTKHLFLILQ